MKFIHAQDIKSHFNIAVLVNYDEVDHYDELFVRALVERLQELDFSDENITVITTSSYLDFPLIAHKLAMTNEYSAVLAGAILSDEDESELSQVEAQLFNISIQSNTPSIMHAFFTDVIQTEAPKDKMWNGACKLAERAYSVISLMGQIA